MGSGPTRPDPARPGPTRPDPVRTGPDRVARLQVVAGDAG